MESLDFQMMRQRESEDWASNKTLERTAAERLGFDIARFMNIVRHSLSPFPAAVAQLGRSVNTFGTDVGLMERFGEPDLF